MLCGPPGSGKTTYARRHAGPGDAVIDLDAIKADLSGMPWYCTDPRWLEPALEQRNGMLRALATKGQAGVAWFIISAPETLERAEWQHMLGAKVIVFELPLMQCRARLKADQRRAGVWQDHFAVAERWWRQYQPRPSEQRMGGDAPNGCDVDGIPFNLPSR